MKTIFLIFLYALFSLNVFGQTQSNEENSAEETTVEEVALARDDGNGSPGKVTNSFTSTDIPIHCLINLSSTKAAAVKLNLIAVAANGYKSETVVISAAYKTNGKQSRVKFKFSPDGIWSAGKYRVDVLIDGKKSGSEDFEIQKSPEETKNENQTPPKPKPKVKS